MFTTLKIFIEGRCLDLPREGLAGRLESRPVTLWATDKDSSLGGQKPAGCSRNNSNYRKGHIC